MTDPNLEINPIKLSPLQSLFCDAIRERPSLYYDFLRVRALSSNAHATIAKWDHMVNPGFFTEEHNLITEKIMNLAVQEPESSLLEDYKQFQIDAEEVQSIWGKHIGIVDMRFWEVESVPVVYEIAAFLGLDNHL